MLESTSRRAAIRFMGRSSVGPVVVRAAGVSSAIMMAARRLLGYALTGSKDIEAMAA